MTDTNINTVDDEKARRAAMKELQHSLLKIARTVPSLRLETTMKIVASIGANANCFAGAIDEPTAQFTTEAIKDGLVAQIVRKDFPTITPEAVSKLETALIELVAKAREVYEIMSRADEALKGIEAFAKNRKVGFTPSAEQPVRVSATNVSPEPVIGFGSK